MSRAMFWHGASAWPTMATVDEVAHWRDGVVEIQAPPQHLVGEAKRELDGRIAAARKAVGVKTPMPPWTIHDLRPTFVTHILDRKLALPHVVEACVNHVSGHKAGVAGIYNRANYADEKRAAIDAWGKHVARLVGER